MYRKRKWKCMWNVLRIILPRPCCADNWHTPHQPPNWKALRLNQFPFIHFTIITCKLFPSHHVDTFALIQKQHLSLLASLQQLLPSNYYYAPRAHLTSLLQLESAIPASILVGVQIQLLQRNLPEVFRFWISSFKASLHPIIVANVKALEINSNICVAFKLQTLLVFHIDTTNLKPQSTSYEKRFDLSLQPCSCRSSQRARTWCTLLFSNQLKIVLQLQFSNCFLPSK